MKKLKWIGLLPLALSVTACSTNCHRVDITPDDPVVVATSKDLLRIAQDIRESNKQLNILLQQKTAQERQQVAAMRSYTVPDSLKIPVTLRWNGKPEPVIEMIAQSIGYTYQRPAGREPMIPLIVSVNALNSQAYDVLKDIGLQLGTQAVLHVNPARKEIGLSYTQLTTVQ